MRKILITGGTVFASMYVAQYFVNLGDNVYVLNRNSREQIKGVKLIESDRNNIGDKLRGIKFDVILDITAYTKEHVKQLLDAVDGFDDYILLSSSAVYPETNIQPFSENQICGFNSVWGSYGSNKIEAEKYLLENVPDAYILRPPYLYGEMQNLYRELFVFDCADQNRKFYLPHDGNMKLQFFNIKDLCIFIQIILEKHPGEHIFNVGNPDLITVREWVELCYKVAGKDIPEFINVNNVDNQRDYFCFYDYEYVLDIKLQKKYLSKTTDLSTGLKDSYLWYKNNKSRLKNTNYFQVKSYIQYIDKKLNRI